MAAEIDARADQPFLDRLSEAVQLAGGPTSAGKALGRTRGTIYAWQRGEGEPSASEISTLCGLIGRSPSWLIWGLDSPADSRSPAVDDDGDLISVPRKAFHVSAGDGAIVEEPLADLPPLAFRADWLRRAVTAPDKAVILTVRGDSMVPTIQDGDLVLIDQAARTIGAGGIFVARIGDDVVVKRLAPSQHPGRVRAISDNADLYPPFDAPADEVAIIGRVRWVGRAL